LNHLSLGLTLDEEEEDEDGEDTICSPLKFREEMQGLLDSSIMWRLLAKNSVIICSIFAESEWDDAMFEDTTFYSRWKPPQREQNILDTPARSTPPAPESRKHITNTSQQENQQSSESKFAREHAFHRDVQQLITKAKKLASSVKDNFSKHESRTAQ